MSKIKVNKKCIACKHVSELHLTNDRKESCRFCTKDVPARLGFEGKYGRIFDVTEFEKCTEFSRA